MREFVILIGVIVGVTLAINAIVSDSVEKSVSELINSLRDAEAKPDNASPRLDVKTENFDE